MEIKGNSGHLNKQYEPEIRVRNVFFHLLYRWRSILLAMILCAAVLGGWQYLRVNAAHRAGNLTKDEQRYERDLAYYQNTLENSQRSLEEWEQKLREQYAVRDHSLLMKLSPENTWAAEKKYLVTGAGDSAADVLAVYTGAMETDHDETELAEAFGTPVAGYVKEITAIRIADGENAFLATVYAADEETAEKGMAYVSRKIEEAEKRAHEIAPHTIQAAAEGIFRAFPSEFGEKQYAVYEDVARHESKVRSASKALFNAEESMPVKQGNPVVRWGIAGAVLGLLAMILVYVTAYAQHGKLGEGSEVSEQYSVPLLGEMNRSGARRPGKGLDGLIEKLEFRKDRKTDDGVYGNTAALIQKTYGKGTLLLAGTVREEVLTAVKAELSRRLGDGTELAICSGFPAESGSAENVCNAEYVLWVEKKHVSRSKEIRRAAEVLEAAGANVIGTLVV